MDHGQHRLTDHQVEYFHTFGFLIRRQVFSPEEMAKINQEFDQRLAAIQRNADPDEERLFDNWANRCPESPYLANLLEDPRIYLPSEQTLGEDAVPVNSNSNSYWKTTPWHADSTDPNLLVMKNVLYLQATTAERGALRLIPGSHKSPLHDELFRIGLDSVDGNEPRFFTGSGIRAEEIPGHVFCSQPGDLIMFNQRTWHAALGGYQDRRTCTFNFCRNPRTAAEQEDLRAYVDGFKGFRKLLGTQGPQFHPWWLANPRASARRARWIKWLEEWGLIEADRE